MHVYVERKRGYYHIFIFPQRTLNQERRGENENLSNGTLQRHPLPQARTFQQAAYHSIELDNTKATRLATTPFAIRYKEIKSMLSYEQCARRHY